jgi:ABC-type glutathione transport system ATPase component
MPEDIDPITQDAPAGPRPPRRAPAKKAEPSSLPPAATVLEVRDLQVSYGPKRAVDGVSFDVREGEIFGLLGPTGPVRPRL